jgi:SAM-dependent methyltransferase
MTATSFFEGDLIRDESSVWVLRNQERFDYSEGNVAERYLEDVLRRAADLGSTSAELDRCIRDWSSEYHLSTKRAQLLSGFSFDRSLRVLEVGCGCGAISRFLGERFDTVVSVEGSLPRARLARLRTRDLPNVEIVCAPFQELAVRRAFDLVVCVGVYEYSAAFVRAADPYDTVLQFFRSAVGVNGALLLAIENQLGLKYFNGMREDHVGTRFEGLEGYHSELAAVRTFGRVELERNLARHFDRVRFYYPFPDYKVPECVLTEEFLRSGKAGELVAQMRARDYGSTARPLWDSFLATLELERNDLLASLSNSFLALATIGEANGVTFEQLGVIYSPRRRPTMKTVTRILRSSDSLIAKKTPLVSGAENQGGALRLRASETEWLDGTSLQTTVYGRCQSGRRDVAWMFLPCKAWVDWLRTHSTTRDGELHVGGEHVDCVWSNVYLRSGECTITDREWVWHSEIRLNVLVVRAIYTFVCQFEGNARVPRFLRGRSGRRVITTIAEGLGVELDKKDFLEFVALEAELQSLVFGFDRRQLQVLITWFLFDRITLKLFRVVRRCGRLVASAMRRTLTV